MRGVQVRCLCVSCLLMYVRRVCARTFFVEPVSALNTDRAPPDDSLFTAGAAPSAAWLAAVRLRRS